MSFCQNCSKINILDLCVAKASSEEITENLSKDEERHTWRFEAYSPEDERQPSIFIAKNVTALENTARAGCGFCRFLWQAIAAQNRLPDPGKDIVDEIRLTIRSDTDSMSLTRIRHLDYPPSEYYNAGWPMLTVLPWKLDLVGDHYRKPLLTPIVDSLADSLFDLAKRWILQCEKEHVGCKTGRERILPKRMIDVGTDITSPTICLRETSTFDNDESSLAKYLALSYIWGNPKAYTDPDPEERLQVHVTKCSNYPDRLDSLVIADLPQTIRDAIHITRRLGYHFLWIDALCIIQNDEDDKTVNIAKMEDVYANAVCVLAASSSTGSDQGMLQPRTWAKYDAGSCSLPLMKKTESSSKIFQTASQLYKRFAARSRSDNTLLPPECRTLTCYYTASGRPIYSTSVDYAPLETRAWCLQERVLATRRLCFSKFGLWWECPDFIASEMEPDKNPIQEHRVSLMNLFHPQHLTGTVPPEQELPPQLQRLASKLPGEPWRKFISDYSSRKSSNPSDKLPALAGAARDWKRIMRPHDEYLAGMWKETIIWDLCWQTVNATQPPLLDRPSWSWATPQRQDVEWPYWGIPTKIDENIFAESELIDHEIKYATWDPFSKVESGWLELKGPFGRVDPMFFDRVRTFSIESKTEEDRVAWMDVSGVIREPWMLVLVRADPEAANGKMGKFHAMILEKAQDGDFCRVGMYTTTIRADFWGFEEAVIRVV